MLRHLLVIASSALAVAIGAANARAQDAPPAAVDAGEGLFAGASIPHLRIEVAPDQLDRLKADPRQYVKAEVREDRRVTFADVALKLKGAAGSFREWQDRPALTLNMHKYRKGASFHGLEKFHLNNSVQDETQLHELLCSELFRKAGVPAPRVTHARVWLNGRDVGLYVLKEGFDRPFLERSFPDPTGNLYDGGFCQDINADLEKDEGTGTDDRGDLRAIVAAASDPDPAARRRRVEALVDLDSFCSFMAMERMTCHWDGYSDKANNYRLYFDPRGGKAVFLPHGMDQTFGETDLPLFGPTDKIVAAVILKDATLRKRHRKRVEELIPLMAPADALIRRVDEVERRLRATIEAMGPDEVARRRDQVAGLKGRLVARAASLRKQVDDPEEAPLEFDDRGIATLAGWRAVSEGEGAIHERVEPAEGRKALRIRIGDGQPGVASWRTRVILGPGDYTLTAEVRADRVVRLPDTEATGVGVGISGVPRDQHLHGTTPARVLRHRFRVAEDLKEVVLVLELRASSGQVWFAQDSLRLIRRASDAR